MNFSPFSCPIFLGHTEARGRCSQGERMLYGRDLCRSGGTGKAEAAKLPGAGIWPEAVFRKMSGRKGRLLKSVRIGIRSRLEKARTVRTIFSLFKLLLGDLPRTKARQRRRIRRPRDTTLHCGQQSRVLRRMFRSLSRAVRLAM